VSKQAFYSLSTQQILNTAIRTARPFPYRPAIFNVIPSNRFTFFPIKEIHKILL
jgi:hypothetical protein